MCILARAASQHHQTVELVRPNQQSELQSYHNVLALALKYITKWWNAKRHQVHNDGKGSPAGIEPASPTRGILPLNYGDNWAFLLGCTKISKILHDVALAKNCSCAKRTCEDRWE